MTPLSIACERSYFHFAIVKELLSFGADPNLSLCGCHALSVACKERDYKMARLLLEHGANIQATGKYGKTALHYALTWVSVGQHADPDMATVNLLLDYGADTNTMSSSGESPLYVACLNGYMAIVQKMLKCGAKVNVSKGQKSPLIAACRKKHPEIVELLCEKEQIQVYLKILQTNVHLHCTLL